MAVRDTFPRQREISGKTHPAAIALKKSPECAGGIIMEKSCP
jgi:hypothetical protein